MKNDIEVVMTAVRRPEILHRTLESFKRNMFGSYKERKIKLIVNIDPVGGTTEHEEMMLDIIEDYFNEFQINFPEEASFPKAFKWCWNQVSAPFVFHLEDDWELIAKVDLQRLLHLLNSDPNLMIMRLPAFHATAENMKCWNKFYPWNGSYYACPPELRLGTGFCGHPSMIKREFIKKTRAFIDDTKNPEKQFHRGGHDQIERVVKVYDYGVYGIPNSPPMIRDIGRPWVAQQTWRKAGGGNKAYFTHWEEEKE